MPTKEHQLKHYPNFLPPRRTRLDTAWHCSHRLLERYFQLGELTLKAS